MDLDIFNITHNKIAPKEGKILLSVPFIEDTFFHKAVIFLVSHNSEATVGYILNKPLPMKLHELVDDIPPSNFAVHIGGPVEHSTLHMIHSLGESIPDSKKVGTNLYWGGDFDVIRKKIHTQEISESNIRFFLGYSGWGPDQLDDEITANTWLVSSLSPKKILSEQQENLWEKVLQNMGAKYKAWTHFPPSPSLN